MFKIINDGQLPTKGTEFSACVDLYANADVVIGAGETVLVPLGVCLNIQEWFEYRPTRIPLPFGGKTGMQDSLNKWKASHYIQLMLRSSLGKKGLILPNGVGIIDMDYKDEIMMILHYPIKNGVGIRLVVDAKDDDRNSMLFHGQEVLIKKGDKIAQIMLCEHKSYLFGIESEAKRDGGFGSTGK